MRRLRVTIGRLLATILLTLCVGLQVLEATGRWDRTVQDSSDEAIIVTVVLCIGAGLAVAGALRDRISLAAIRSRIVLVEPARLTSITIPPLRLAVCASPPLSLRI